MSGGRKPEGCAGDGLRGLDRPASARRERGVQHPSPGRSSRAATAAAYAGPSCGNLLSYVAARDVKNSWTCVRSSLTGA
ncbi:hypothetical protein [Streptomyces acidiscabies]|uniref:hypothetical protein n=1 Tax=Streptomyces acidiscabies TaxID=42234 RepID=UPI0015B7A726|nr:hypothetical protein [Streptomyces acidiscabies]